MMRARVVSRVPEASCGSFAGACATMGARVVVPDGTSSENADPAQAKAVTRRTALKRDISREAVGSGTPREAPRDAALEPGLYVVATPIGNLGDITQRALQVLARAALVAAEDTRVTRGLLHHFGLSAKLVALHEHNEARAAEAVLRAIAKGDAVALVSDAGTPAVSDPGHVVVQRVREAGHRVIPVPGPSALTAALSASGLAFEGVVFAGFLPAKGTARRERLQALAAGPWAVALFESPHRVAQTLEDLHAALGERDVVIAREITKKFETIERVALAGARAWIEADPDRTRGEFVLVVQGRAVEASPSMDTHAVLDALLAELPVKQAVALAVRITGAPRNELYAAALERKGKPA
jgi:16S rRNA (cytidine1402-2'-O)-methyltransferase